MTRFAIEYEMRCSEQSDISAHLPYLYERACGASTILELGVRSGNSTAALLAGAEKVGGHVWSVDWAPPWVPEEWFDSDLWTMTVGDDLSWPVVESQPAAVDLLFIDTSHTYDHTLAELREYGPRVRPGGVILLHDTELERPESAPPDGPPFPVRKAVEEWCDEAADAGMDVGVTFTPGSYGLGVIELDRP